MTYSEMIVKCLFLAT